MTVLDTNVVSEVLKPIRKGSRNWVLATRNTKDFEHCGVNLVNPWDS
jgi:predicted nucleic acid-binding protein